MENTYHFRMHLLYFPEYLLPDFQGSTTETGRSRIVTYSQKKLSLIVSENSKTEPGRFESLKLQQS